jgi:DNA-binding transcriptional ArsR family regulator
MVVLLPAPPKGAATARAIGRQRVASVQPRLYRSGVIVVSPVVDLEVLARLGVALADDSRRRLLVAMLDGPAYPADLAEMLDLTRANVSNHLACLRGCGLVVRQPEGRRVRYELADPRLGRALRDLLAVVLAADPRLCPAADTDGCC